MTGITLNEIQEDILNVIPLLKPKDSTFVRMLVKMLYENDLRALENRTVVRSGKKKETNKQPMTPEKRNFVIKKMEERIRRGNFDKDEMNERMEYYYVCKLISSAICNIIRSKEMKSSNV